MPDQGMILRAFGSVASLFAGHEWGAMRLAVMPPTRER